jgi:hypothetical protein
MPTDRRYRAPVKIAECPCHICSGTDPGRDTGIVETVLAHGWCVLSVHGGGPDFAYTVGLWHTFRRPEIVMFGLQTEGMHVWLNACVNLHRDRAWPEDDQPFEGVIEGFPTQLRSVDESWRDGLFGSAYRFYRGWPVPVRQLVWPDRNGLWPWESGATPSSRTRQAYAWMPVSEHPEGGWKLVGEIGADFPFPGGPDARVLTTRSVAQGRRPIARVACEQGCYDVLDDRGYAADDLCVMYLGHLFQQRPEIAAYAELPDGHDSDGPLTEVDRERSAQAWKAAI